MSREKENASGRGLLSGIVGGTLSLTLSTLIVKIIGLIYKIPISSLLGDGGMGYFNSAYTVYAFFYLLCTAGVPKAVMILISEAKARGRAAEEVSILKIASALFLSLGGFLTAVFIIFASPIARLIGNSGAYFTMIAIAPSIILVSLSGVIRGYLSANSRLTDIAVSQIIEGVGKLSLGLLFAMIGTRMKMPLTILSAMTILGVTMGCFFGLLYLLICSKIKIKNEKTGQNKENAHFMPVARRILSISVPITLSAAIMSLTNLIDLGLIMRSLISMGYTEERASALYGNYTTLAVPMLNLATAIISPISIAFLPVFTRCRVSSDEDKLMRAERSAIELCAMLSAPMMIGLIVYAREILGMLFKNSEIEIGAILLCLISPAILFSSLLLIVNTSLEACGKVRAPLISMTVGGVVKIISSLYFITKADMGIMGAPLGTVLSYAAAIVVSSIIYAKTFKRHIPLFELSFMPHLNALISVLLSRLVYGWLISRIPMTPALLCAIALCALIYLAISSFCGIVSPKKIGELAKYTKLS